MRLGLVLALLLAGGLAEASPPPPPPREDDSVSEWREERALFETSTWIRLGVGLESAREPIAARGTAPSTIEQRTAWEFGAGVDMTFPIPTGRVRLGPWLEMRGSDPFAGGELLIAGIPSELDMFWYRGEGALVVRAGGNMTHATAAIAYGYRAPWALWGPWNTTSRYAIGVRLVASATQAIHDPKDWTMTVGVEFEPIGSLRYLLGIKSWY